LSTTHGKTSVEGRQSLYAGFLVAKRARQLVDGAQPLVEADSPNLVSQACEELAQDVIRLVHGHVTPYIPLRPEVEAARLAARNAALNASTAEAIREELDQIASTADMDESDARIIAEEIEKNIAAPDSETGADHPAEPADADQETEE
jgi:hypothetical protein